jgi:hypothetical protein
MSLPHAPGGKLPFLSQRGGGGARGVPPLPALPPRDGALRNGRSRRRGSPPVPARRGSHRRGCRRRRRTGGNRVTHGNDTAASAAPLHPRLRRGPRGLRPDPASPPCQTAPDGDKSSCNGCGVLQRLFKSPPLPCALSAALRHDAHGPPQRDSCMSAGTGTAPRLSPTLDWRRLALFLAKRSIPGVEAGDERRYRRSVTAFLPGKTPRGKAGSSSRGNRTCFGTRPRLESSGRSAPGSPPGAAALRPGVHAGPGGDGARPSRHRGRDFGSPAPSTASRWRSVPYWDSRYP